MNVTRVVKLVCAQCGTHVRDMQEVQHHNDFPEHDHDYELCNPCAVTISTKMTDAGLHRIMVAVILRDLSDGETRHLVAEARRATTDDTEAAALVWSTLVTQAS